MILIQCTAYVVSDVNASSKLGGRSTEGVECGRGVPLPTEHPLPTGGGIWEGATLLFSDLKMVYFVNSEVLNLKFSFIIRY